MNSYFKLVLLTAIFIATTFTVSCSGDDGKDGANCTVSGNVITCGDNTVTIPGGVGGNPGDPGQPGTPGASCVPNVDGNGSVWIKCGTAAAIMVSCGGSPFNSKTQICDARDGNAYKFVDIDGQIWLAENLKFKTAGSVCYDGLPSNCAKYGRLYTWDEAKVACPSGWSLPDTTEFAALIAFAGTGAAAKLKSEEIGGTDDFGFGALLGGYNGGSFTGEGSLSYFWSDTENDIDNSQSNYIIISTQTSTNQSAGNKTNMLSVRCIKN